MPAARGGSGGSPLAGPRVALITGGASGIGLATAERLRRDGLSVALADIDAAGLWGNKGAAIYSASKGGVTVLSKALAVELAARGVRVNVVYPGDVDSPMIRYQAETFGGGDPEAYLRDLLAAYPQKPARFIRPDEVAELIAFLCSERATPITGAAISIDFGLTAGY